MEADEMPNPRFEFSNFQRAVVDLEGRPCPTVEHAYQAAKTLDPVEREWVIASKTAAEAKHRGREVTVRPDWDDIKIEVMFGLLRQKFAPGTRHAEKLLAFQGLIVEYNWWHDRFWGVCTCAGHRRHGANNLGMLLTRIRWELLARVAKERTAA
jgi:N-glycosidase YbiA